MRRTLAALFAVYLAVLVWVVLWKAHLPFIGRDDMREIKLVPFVSGEGYGFSDPYEVLANLLLFVPLGIYLGALGVKGAVPIVVGTSLALEVAQFVLATGSSDVTDVVVNTVGGLIGLGFVIALKPKPRVLAVVLVAGTVLALVAIFLYSRTFQTMQPGMGPTII